MLHKEVQQFKNLNCSNDYDDNRHFFLSQYFRNNYNKALKNYPLINSRVNITKVEVWVTNRNATTVDIRNIVALADIGEGNATNIGPANVIPIQVCSITLQIKQIIFSSILTVT